MLQKGEFLMKNWKKVLLGLVLTSAIGMGAEVYAENGYYADGIAMVQGMRIEGQIVPGMSRGAVLRALPRYYSHSNDHAMESLLGKGYDTYMFEIGDTTLVPVDLGENLSEAEKYKDAGHYTDFMSCTFKGNRLYEATIMYDFELKMNPSDMERRLMEDEVNHFYNLLVQEAIKQWGNGIDTGNPDYIERTWKTKEGYIAIGLLKPFRDEPAIFPTWLVSITREQEIPGENLRSDT